MKMTDRGSFLGAIKNKSDENKKRQNSIPEKLRKNNGQEMQNAVSSFEVLQNMRVSIFHENVPKMKLKSNTNPPKRDSETMQKSIGLFGSKKTRKICP